MAWGRRSSAVSAAAVTFLILLANVSTSSASSGGLGRPDTLTVDGLAAPVGLGANDVRFAWHVNDTRRGAVQAAYRIVVSAGQHVVWDSGRVSSPEQSFVPYAGPGLASDAVYRWTVQTWAGTGGPGPEAAAATFETALNDSDWRASWIRRDATDPVDAQDEYTYLRKETVLGPSPIVRARAFVSADQQYELYVNGARAGKGQAYSYPDSQYYETVDVTGLLRAGAANAVGLIYNWQGATKGHPAGAPGAIAQISVQHGDGSHELITTDGTWRVLRGAWLPGTQRDEEGDLVDYTENINGPAYPSGWDRPGFNDQLWAPATVIGKAPVAPWTHLVPVVTRIVEEPVVARSLTTLPSGAVVADFGQVYAAVPTVLFHHGVPGKAISMRAGFLIDEPTPGSPVAGEPGQVSVLHGTQHTDMSYSYVQRGGVEQFHPFDYLGFRYFQIDAPGETLLPADVVALTRHTFVADEHAATFASPDPTVDAVFELGRHSALFTAQEQFLDTPTREKGPWLWDGFNESQTAMATLGDQNLTRKSLLEFAQSQARFWPQGGVNKIYPTGLGALNINEFTEIYPEWVWQYWLRTGDRTVLANVYPVLSGISNYVDRSIEPATGLVANLPATSIYYAFPVVTRLNVLGVNVFRRAADVAALLGRSVAEINLQRQRQAALTNAINTRLTRPDGLYVDGLQANGTQVNQVSQDANTAAVAYDVVPAPRLAAVAAHVAALGMSSVPRTATEVLETLAAAGRDGDVLRRLTDPKTDGWANILARGGTFTWEVWEPSDNNGDSMSHGWGSNAAVAIQSLLLGVRPIVAGFGAFEVAPPLTGLGRASGRVPTPKGAITVDWARPATADGPFTLDVVVPPNATATVRLPALGPADITESGKALGRAAGVKFIAMDGSVAVLDVGAGSYAFRSAPVPAAVVGGVGAPGTNGGSAAGGPASVATGGGAAAGGTGPSSPGAEAGAGAVGGHGSPPAGVAAPAAAKRGSAWPWWLLAIVLVAIVGVAALAVARRRRERRDGVAPPA